VAVAEVQGTVLLASVRPETCNRAQPQDKSRPRHPEKARLTDTPVLRKPDWIRVKALGPHAFDETRATLRKHRLNTVCEEAACPNIGECWGKRTQP